MIFFSPNQRNSGNKHNVALSNSRKPGTLVKYSTQSLIIMKYTSAIASVNFIMPRDLVEYFPK